jgi:hypothetical protein
MVVWGRVGVWFGSWGGGLRKHGLYVADADGGLGKAG